jgi:hypothetical protein
VAYGRVIHKLFCLPVYLDSKYKGGASLRNCAVAGFRGGSLGLLPLLLPSLEILMTEALNNASQTACVKFESGPFNRGRRGFNAAALIPFKSAFAEVRKLGFVCLKSF